VLGGLGEWFEFESPTVAPAGGEFGIMRWLLGERRPGTRWRAALGFVAMACLVLSMSLDLASDPRYVVPDIICLVIAAVIAVVNAVRWVVTPPLPPRRREQSAHRVD
jgi:uncharacterized membrane protein YccC